jgi:diguanylate cyclase (GGDEF)-like protein
MLFKRNDQASFSADIFPMTDTLPAFVDTMPVQADPQRRKEKSPAAPSSRTILQKWLLGIGINSLYLFTMLVFYKIDLIEKSTLFIITGMFAVMTLFFFLIFKTNLNLRFQEKRLKFPIVVTVFTCMLVVFYLAPATQIIFTPFAFVAVAYGMYRITTKNLMLLLVVVFIAMALIIEQHYRQSHNLALLKMEAMHFLVLILTLPLFILFVGKVQELHRVLHKASRKIHYIQEDAKRDVLIDCFNRRYMVAMLEKQKHLADKNGTPLCLAVLDLDHFKKINDTFGHLGGDEVLRTFSKVAQENIRTSDVFGRYGGEEFLLIFPDTSLLPALNTSERIRAHIEHVSWSDDLDCHVTVSIGVTQYIPGESMLELFSRTDTAMYLAKEGGRNQVVVEEPVTRTGEYSGDFV